MLGVGLIFFLAVLQGATELFPVSSLGHSVVVPSLLRLDFHPSDPSFVPVLTVLHLGTATALLILYRDQWVRIIAGLGRALARGDINEPDGRLGVLLIIGTIPAGVVGFVFQSPLTALFGSPRAAASFLIVNGAILLTAEWFRRRDERKQTEAGHAAPAAGLPDAPAPGEEAEEVQDPEYLSVERLNLRSALIVGFCQAAALFPGISRSGITMAAGLVAGLRHQEAARFSFLLATPVIAAAGLLELVDLPRSHPGAAVLAGAAVVAGVISYVSARFLLRYLRFGRLDPFAYYCGALGVAGLIFAR